MRICIIGGPRTGKTTLASGMANVLHSDDLIGELDWSAASERIATDWLAANPSGKPCERIIVMLSPKVELSKGQASMAKGCAKVWVEIEASVRGRGVEIEIRA